MRTVCLLVLVGACSGASTAEVPRPTPVRNPGGDGSRSEPEQDDTLQRARETLTDCSDGEGFLSLWNSLDERTREGLTTDADRSLALQARWEPLRLLLPREDGNHVFDSGATTRFESEVTLVTDAVPPTFWGYVLREATVYPTGVVAYPVVEPMTDRYVASHRLAGHVTRTPGDVVLAELADGRVEIRTRTGTVAVPETVLALDTGKPSHLEALVTGDHAFVVPFDAGSGGFPFEVRSVDPSTGTVRWTATACAAGRSVLGGLGAMLLELALVDGTLVIWGAESHGAWIDAFDAATGDVAYRFSSDLWMARQSRATSVL